MARQDLTDEQIRIRAYEIFLRRGGHGGSPEEDWLLAEQELVPSAAEPAPAAAKPAAKPAAAKPTSAKPAAAKTAAAKATAAKPGEPAPPKKSVRTVSSNTASRRSR